MQPDAEMIYRWSSSAPFWEKHRDLIRDMFAPATKALIEAAQIATGQRVLDVATGAGDPALSLAALVGPKGSVCGVDLAREMVAAARRAADRVGLGNAQFEAALADRLPFDDATFDAVVSRFGVMFFPSPVDAVREMLRVLKPGRKLAFAVWHYPDTNPFLDIPSRVLDQFVDAPPQMPDAPDGFRFARPGKLRSFLIEAGAVNTAERHVPFTIEVPMKAEGYWDLRCEMSEKLRDKIATLATGQTAEMKRQVFEALREYTTERGLSFPAEILIVSGTR